MPCQPYQGGKESGGGEEEKKVERHLNDAPCWITNSGCDISSTAFGRFRQCCLSAGETFRSTPNGTLIPRTECEGGATVSGNIGLRRLRKRPITVCSRASSDMILTRLDIWLHIAVCTVWRLSPDDWTPAYFGPYMRRPSRDRRAWEYRSMTDEELENRMRDQAIR